MSLTVLVTGASSGIGEATCRLLVANGYRVIGTARSVDKLQQMARELGDGFHALELDVNDAAAVAELPDSLPADFREIEVLVNNAGHDTGGRQPFEDTDLESMCSVIETNVQGLIRVTHAMIAGMLARGNGHIVNIGSEVAVDPVATMSAYVASKFAVNGFSKTLRREYANRGIRISEIMPGRVRTGFAEQRLGDAQKAAEFYDSFDACLNPEDVAATVLFTLRQPRHVEIAQLLVLPVSQSGALE